MSDVGCWALNVLEFSMPTFQYRALQSDGKIAEGELEAGGRQEAFRQMEDRGLRPISVAERGNGKPQKTAQRNGKTEKPEQPKADSPSTPATLLKLSFGASTKISARMLENFTRLL